MKNLKFLQVYYNKKLVGELGITKEGTVAFAYDNSWLSTGFSLNPFRLPLERRVFVAPNDPFNGLFGVFADTLPDGWGHLLVDRFLLTKGINPHSVNPLVRLSLVNDEGMGALEYIPKMGEENSLATLDLDVLARECKEFLTTDDCHDLDTLFRLGGSSGGARPKINIVHENELWLVKFPCSTDDINIGSQEFNYAKCAVECGLPMAPIKLFPSKICQGYFGTKRFDRQKEPQGKNKKIHMVSVSGLLETSHRTPNLDYNDLMRLTLQLTKSFAQVEALYRLMCFNVFAHNRDDHSKNFSYLYDDAAQEWRLSPPYDLTFSYSLGGELATSVNGNGMDPGLEDLLAVAEKIGIKRKWAEETALFIQQKVEKQLKNYLQKGRNTI